MLVLATYVVQSEFSFRNVLLVHGMPLQGLQIITRTQLEQMLVFTQFVARRLYNTYVLPNTPVSRRTPEQLGRNTLIRERFRAGEDTYTLAEEYGISLQRVYQILHYRRN
jgi:hypothetical protein